MKKVRVNLNSECLSMCVDDQSYQFIRPNEKEQNGSMWRENVKEGGRGEGYKQDRTMIGIEDGRQ